MTIILNIAAVSIALLEPSSQHANWSEGTITNIAPQVSIGRFLCSSVSDYCTAITNAITGGYKLINLPVGWNVPPNSNQLYKVFSWAQDKILIINSAPNDYIAPEYNSQPICNQYGYCYTNIDWPSHFKFTNILTINGLYTNGQPIFSYSTQYFNFSAPAYNVTTYSNTLWHGNSAACALVSGYICKAMELFPQDNILERISHSLVIQSNLTRHNITSAALDTNKILRAFSYIITLEDTNLVGHASWNPVMTNKFIGNSSKAIYKLEIR